MMQLLLLFVANKEGKKCSIYYFLLQKRKGKNAVFTTFCGKKFVFWKKIFKTIFNMIFKIDLQRKKIFKKNLQRKKIFKKWSSKKKIYNKDLQRREIFNKDLKEKKSSKKIFKEKKILRKRSSLSGVGFEPTHMVASSLKSNALTTQPPRLAW